MNRELASISAIMAGGWDWLLFSWGRFRVKQTQMRLLRTYLKHNRTTQWGQAHGFAKLRSYEDYCRCATTHYTDYQPSINRIQNGERSVLTQATPSVLLPTSGTTGTKLIPYTTAVQNEFRRALNVWLVNSLLRCWRAFAGRHYWSMSPAINHYQEQQGAVAVGFSSDLSYFGPRRGTLLSRGFAVPPTIQQVRDTTAHDYLTLLFLLREARLSYIFIWSPTFLIAKLANVHQWRTSLLTDIAQGTLSARYVPLSADRELFAATLHANPARSKALAAIDFSDRLQWHRIWPHLQMISCWADAWSIDFCKQLAKLFPATRIEQKGLVATEAVVTIPWWHGGLKPVAYRSHFFEFRELSSGKILPLWRLQSQVRYSVVVTTGGGLYRYELRDIVEVNGFLGAIPCLRFIGRESATLDLVGEKVTEESIIEFFQTSPLFKNSQPLSFVMVAPTNGDQTMCYTLFVELNHSEQIDMQKLADSFDAALSANIYYRHARQQGQLAYPRIFSIKPNTALGCYLETEQASGKKAGDIKLRLLDSSFSWQERFEGAFITLKERP